MSNKESDNIDRAHPHESTIQEIRAKAHTPLSRNGRLISLCDPIWQAPSTFKPDKTSCHSVLFQINQFDKPELIIMLNISGSIPNGPLYLEIRYQKNLLLLGESESFTGNRSNLFNINIELQIKPTDFFVIRGSELSWFIRRKDSGFKYILPSPELDIYWIYNYDTKLFKRGIPLELLQIISRNCQIPSPQTGTLFLSAPGNRQLPVNTAADNFKEKLIGSIVNYIFNRNPPRYDTISGSNHITYGEPDDVTLYLNRYLDIGNTVNKLCNCYDQAAVLQCFLKSIGILDVKYCITNPFGCIATTRLIGIGQSNNPLFGAPPSRFQLLKNPFDTRRTRFESHSFCCLEDENGNHDNDRILDTSIGPHTGNENHQQYLNSVIDNDCFYLVAPPELGDLERYCGLKHLLWDIPVTSTSPAQTSNAKISPSDYSSHMASTAATEEFIVYDWPSPTGCPELKNQGWTLQYEGLGPGTGETIKTWVLGNNNQRLKIDLYVTRSDRHITINRFNSMCDRIRNTSSNFRSNQETLGNHFLMFKAGSQQRFLKSFHNVIFDVFCHDVTFDTHRLLDWLSHIPQTRVYPSLPVNTLPNFDKITLIPEYVTHMQDIVVRHGSTPYIHWDFTLENENLLLVDETSEYFCFKAVNCGKENLTVLATDKRTLITNHEVFEIHIQENNQTKNTGGKCK